MDDLNVHVFQNRNWYIPKSDRFFFLTLTVGRPFHWRDFRRKNFGVKGLLFEEKEALHAELNERAEAATSSYSAAVDFIQYI